MWRAALFVGFVITSACGAYGNDPSLPGRPDACKWERRACARSSECCSGWCVNWACERKMAEQNTQPGLSEWTVQ